MKKTKTFRSGNSVAVRLPSALGVGPGVEVTVREERGRYIIEPVGRKAKKIDLSGIYGAGAGLKPLKPSDRIIEGRDLDWDGKRLRDG